jgi:hypothetical protein
MRQGRKSRWTRASRRALAIAVLTLAAPVAAASAQPAADEYDLVLPTPGDAATAAPTAPAPVAPYVEPETGELVVPPAVEEKPVIKPMDVDAANRDVLFALPNSAQRADASALGGLAADDSGAGTMGTLLAVLAAIAAALVLATLWRLRRFARAAASQVGPGAPRVPGSTPAS